MEKTGPCAPSLPRTAAILIPAILLAVFALAGCLGNSQSPAEAGMFTYPNATVYIISTTGNYNVTAQVAATQEQQEFGLMFRDSLPEGAGMIFPFSSRGNYAFYMKNMRIPLDIIYAAPVAEGLKDNYAVVKVTENIQPCSKDPCPLDYSGDGVSIVLEVPAGYAQARGIGPGDRLIVTYSK
ncbi:MAG: DUF192 domain-containing protein [Candidatus Micrarchaeia archaeon]